MVTKTGFIIHADYMVGKERKIRFLNFHGLWNISKYVLPKMIRGYVCKIGKPTWDAKDTLVEELKAFMVAFQGLRDAWTEFLDLRRRAKEKMFVIEAKGRHDDRPDIHLLFAVWFLVRQLRP